MSTQDKNLAMVIKELHKAFDCFNKEFYNNELPKVIITIQSRGKRNALSSEERKEKMEESNT